MQGSKKSSRGGGLVRGEGGSTKFEKEGVSDTGG